MNSYFQEGNRGASITPSSRRSIHSCRDSEMVRYGLNTSREVKDRAYSPGNHEKGTDEVDNVLSKMCHQPSPLPIRKKKIHRTNSYSNEVENTEDDDDSDDTELDEPNFSMGSSTKSFEDSYRSQINYSNQSSHMQSSLYQQNLSSSRIDTRNKKSNKSQCYVIVVGVVIAVLAVCYVNKPTILVQYSTSDKSTQTVNSHEVLFENNMNLLQKKYNIDQNLILKLKAGISTIFSRMDTGSFMFVYNSDTGDFDPSHFEMFVNEVAYTTARYLRNNMSSIKHTVISSSSLDMQKHGELITRYKDDVDKSGVLLVKEVDNVPSDLAMAFHYYCDEYNPLVKRSAIFFTLNLANCSNASEKKSTHDFIEKCLAGKWKTVPPANIRPLLTRVVDIIIDVSSVF